MGWNLKNIFYLDYIFGIHDKNFDCAVAHKNQKFIRYTRVIVLALHLKCLPLFSEILENRFIMHIGRSQFTSYGFIVSTCSCSNFQSFGTLCSKYVRRPGNSFGFITPFLKIGVGNGAWWFP